MLNTHHQTIKIDEKGDRIDMEFGTKIKNVTRGLGGWLKQTLESEVDLTEYIHQNIQQTEEQKPAKQRQTHLYKTNQVPSEEKEERKYEFVQELEAAMSTWKPSFLNNKKGKMLNIISESVAPNSVLLGLNANFGVKVSNRPLMKDPIYVHGNKKNNTQVSSFLFHD